MRWTSSYKVCFSYHEDSLELCYFLPIPITHTFQSFSSCSGCFVWNDCPLTFSDAQGKDAEELTAVARQEDGILFYMTSDADVAKIFGLNKKAPALVLRKKENEKLSTFDGAFEREAISEFLSANKLPLVVIFNHETASAIFEDEASRQLLLFALPKEFDKIRDNFEEAAKFFKRKIIFVLVDLADKEAATPVLNFFALTTEETKMIGFSIEENGRKFMYSGDYSVESIKTFGEKFLAGDLPYYLKSEPIPDKNDGNVKIVVGDSFDDIVLDETKDVLLEVYAPWCGHCRNLEPEYNRLGEILKDIPSIVIAKMDGTTNEHAVVQIQGFPTILFFPAGDKSKEPLAVQTERTVEAFVDYIKKNAAIPFTAPEIPKLKLEDPTDLGVEEDEGDEDIKDLSADDKVDREENIKDEL
jgi:protein disulfide-isomerase A1